MKKTKLLCLLVAGAAGCFDLDALQSEYGTSQDMAMAMPDLAMPTPPDMTMPNPTPADMTVPRDMVVPPDLMPVPFAWSNESPTVPPLNLYAISGVTVGGTTNIYAVGKTATFLKSTGGQFAAGVGPTGVVTDFNALWLKDANNVYVAESTGKVFLTTDAAATAANWSDKATGAPNSQRAIAGLAGKDEVLVGGDDTSKALILKPLSATAWTATNANCTQTKKIFGIWGGTNYYAIVGEGLRISKSQDPVAGCNSIMQMGVSGTPDLTAVHGNSDTSVWAVSKDGQLMSTDLTGNNKLQREANVTGATFNAIWAKADNNVWVVGTKVWQWNGTTLIDRTGDLPAGYTFTGVWGNATNVWIVGNLATAGAIFKH